MKYLQGLEDAQFRTVLNTLDYFYSRKIQAFIFMAVFKANIM